MTKTEQELGLQLGAANAEIQELKEERDNALKASRYEADLCQQAIADLEPYRADAAVYQHLLERAQQVLRGCLEHPDAAEVVAELEYALELNDAKLKELNHG